MIKIIEKKTTKAAESKKTTKATTAKSSTAKKTTKASTAKSSTKAVKEEAKEEKAPVFKNLKEELAWLKKKKVKTPAEEMRIAYLESPVKVICTPIKKTVKKKVAKKKVAKKKVELEPGEYFPTPKTLPKLKTYMNSYIKAVGWKVKNYTFPDTKKLFLSEVKVTSDKEKNEAYFEGKLTYQNSHQMYSHRFKRTFTLENYKSFFPMIKATYKMVKDNFAGKDTVDTKFFTDREWSCVYDA